VEEKDKKRREAEEEYAEEGNKDGEWF